MDRRDDVGRLRVPQRVGQWESEKAEVGGLAGLDATGGPAGLVERCQKHREGALRFESLLRAEDLAAGRAAGGGGGDGLPGDGGAEGCVGAASNGDAAADEGGAGPEAWLVVAVHLVELGVAACVDEGRLGDDGDVVAGKAGGLVGAGDGGVFDPVVRMCADFVPGGQRQEDLGSLDAVDGDGRPCR